MKHLIWIGLMLAATGTAWAAGGEELIQQYRQEAGQTPSAERGRALWQHKAPAPNGGAARSCTACHGSDLTRPGKHLRTGKVIPPMARSVRPEALSDEKNIRKWLTRNCKWTLGRECTALEKADVLSYLLRGKWI
jgi:cytochrome c553